jgi:thioredoxin reductase
MLESEFVVKRVRDYPSRDMARESWEFTVGVKGGNNEAGLAASELRRIADELDAMVALATKD